MLLSVLCWGKEERMVWIPIGEGSGWLMKKREREGDLMWLCVLCWGKGERMVYLLRVLVVVLLGGGVFY